MHPGSYVSRVRVRVKVRVRVRIRVGRRFSGYPRFAETALTTQSNFSETWI